MTQDYTYNRGEWIEGNPISELIDNENFDDWLKRIGFQKSFDFCTDVCLESMVEIYVNIDSDKWFASICIDGCSCYYVFLPDFPSYMMFIKDYAPAITLIDNSQQQNYIRELLEKLFRVYHGHDAMECCYTCDPDRMEMIARNRKERAAKKLERESEDRTRSEAP